MYSKEDLEIIQNIILEEISSVEKLILFGSYARNEANEDSDIDILVLTKAYFERERKLNLLTTLRWKIAQLGYKADIIIKSSEDFEDDWSHPTLSNVIHNEGLVLWSAQ
jgi:predicted nucleotidyltransferase